MKTITWITMIALFLALAPAGQACTNYLISKGASTDGSTMITYSADSHTLYGDLNFIPAGEHIDGHLDRRLRRRYRASTWARSARCAAPSRWSA